MKRKYRIVRTHVAGMLYVYDVQVWRWWFPFWVNLSFGCGSPQRAIDLLRQHNGGPYSGPLDLVDR